MDQPDQIVLHEIAIVIVGQNHNPSVLNPDFLRHNDIVPEGLELAEPAIGTLAFSQVVYNSGLRIVSEPNRISFAENVLGGEKPVCPGVARRYLREVPHVRYTAIGINPVGVLSAKSPIFPAGLLKTGEWLQFDGVSPSAEIKLTYKLGGQTVNLTVKTDTVQTPEGGKEALVFHGNFHCDIKAENNESHMAAHAIAGEWQKCAEDFVRLAENIAKGMRE